MDPTYLSKIFYLLNFGVCLYHKKNSHTSNLKLIITKIKLKMMSSILLSFSTKKKKEKKEKKKVFYRFYTLLFVNIYIF